MPAKNRDLHGHAPDTAAAALLLIDVINDLEFEGGDRLLTHAVPMAKRIAPLRRRAKQAGMPVIYAWWCRPIASLPMRWRTMPMRCGRWPRC